MPGAVIAGLNTAHGITRGSITRRFRDLGVIGHVRRADIEHVREELILCGHDHLQALHTVERGVHGLVISTAGTISNRLRPGRASSFNHVTMDERTLGITTYAWQESEGFVPSEERSYRRKVATEAL